jgi:mRNA-degrading endonuclease YafQ of YafQ-DinJ toxin-antitoxin module
VSYSISTTATFERNLRKFVRKHPELKQRVDQVITDLHEDPFQPHLHLHQLCGNLRDFHAVRIDYSRRIVLTLQVDEREITLVAIGSHDEVYR